MNDEDKKKMTVDKKTAGRRKLLKSVIAGGGTVTVAKMMPEQWARPVVDSVMLPSHATTSQLSPFGPFVNANGPFAMADQETQLAEQGFSKELLEFFAPAAEARIDSVYLNSMSLTVNESGKAYLCGTCNSSTQVLAVQVTNNSFTINTEQCLFGNRVGGGNFVENVGWNINFPNVATTVTLTSGGEGCSPSNDPGSCTQSKACPIPG